MLWSRLWLWGDIDLEAGTLLSSIADMIAMEDRERIFGWPSEAFVPVVNPSDGHPPVAVECFPTFDDFADDLRFSHFGELMLDLVVHLPAVLNVDPT